MGQVKKSTQPTSVPSLRDHSIVDPGFAIGGVEEHMRVIDDSKAAISENGDVLVESHANTRHLGLGDTAVRTESLDEVIDLAGRDPSRSASITTANSA